MSSRSVCVSAGVFVCMRVCKQGCVYLWECTCSVRLFAGVYDLYVFRRVCVQEFVCAVFVGRFWAYMGSVVDSMSEAYAGIFSVGLFL